MMKKLALLSLFAVSMMSFVVSAEESLDKCCHKVEKQLKKVECESEKINHELKKLICWVKENLEGICCEIEEIDKTEISTKRLLEALLCALREKLTCDPCCELDRLQGAADCLGSQVACILETLRNC